VLEVRSISEIPEGVTELAVAIGKFDGLHVGHAQIIHELVDYCSEASLVPAVITFDRHPNEVLDPASVPGALIGPIQKRELLEDLGVELLIELPFDRDLASLSALQFVEQVLVQANARMVFVGADFKFGSGGKGNPELLRELGPQGGFRVREVPAVKLGDKRISSTAVREALDLGRVDVAAVMLGRSHKITGEIEHGKKLGRTFGFPTANFSRSSEGYLPADGVYAGYLWVDGVKMPAAHSVGTNDSVAEVPRLIESHVLDRDDLDLYGKICTAELVAQVRPWSKFGSLDELLVQIAKDVSQTKEILGSIEP
jgi:riboflavin kinase / FMN adenylyltransferase